MCLALPGRVIEIVKEANLLMGNVDFSGLRKKVCLEYTPEASIGDYVIVHVGFAISILNREQAQATLDLLEEIHP